MEMLRAKKWAHFSRIIVARFDWNYSSYLSSDVIDAHARLHQDCYHSKVLIYVSYMIHWAFKELHQFILE